MFAPSPGNHKPEIAHMKQILQASKQYGKETHDKLYSPRIRSPNTNAQLHMSPFLLAAELEANTHISLLSNTVPLSRATNEL